MMSKCAAAISYTQLVKVIHYLVTGKSQEFIHFLTLWPKEVKDGSNGVEMQWFLVNELPHPFIEA